MQLVPAFVARVGLFLDQDAERVAGILEQVPLSLLQFHGREDAAYCRQFGLPYIKAVSMNAGLAAKQALKQAEAEFPDAAALLMDSHEAGGLALASLRVARLSSGSPRGLAASVSLGGSPGPAARGSSRGVPDRCSRAGASGWRSSR